jgi:hypothetical protein
MGVSGRLYFAIVGRWHTGKETGAVGFLGLGRSTRVDTKSNRNYKSNSKARRRFTFPPIAMRLRWMGHPVWMGCSAKEQATAERKQIPFRGHNKKGNTLHDETVGSLRGRIYPPKQLWLVDRGQRASAFAGVTLFAGVGGL